MIEVPRAALRAAELAPSVDFMSFGTNDLSQMCLGLSRDDAQAFLPAYVSAGLLPRSPFESIDVDGVGWLVAHACREARAANPRIRLGICGEHGGDPQSILFFQSVAELDYISCSPLRVPGAMLAAAHAAIQRGWKEKESN
jgi:pyruvate,orthophosphate dikinase